jgi:hypothetical protein
MFERLSKLPGGSIGAKAATALITSALFAAAHHLGQGIPGVEQAAVTGLVFGIIFATARRIFMLMIADSYTHAKHILEDR